MDFGIRKERVRAGDGRRESSACRRGKRRREKWGEKRGEEEEREKIWNEKRTQGGRILFVFWSSCVLRVLLLCLFTFASVLVSLTFFFLSLSCLLFFCFFISLLVVSSCLSLLLFLLVCHISFASPVLSHLLPSHLFSSLLLGFLASLLCAACSARIHFCDGALFSVLRLLPEFMFVRGAYRHPPDTDTSTRIEHHVRRCLSRRCVVGVWLCIFPFRPQSPRFFRTKDGVRLPTSAASQRQTFSTLSVK